MRHQKKFYRKNKRRKHPDANSRMRSRSNTTVGRNDVELKYGNLAALKRSHSVGMKNKKELEIDDNVTVVSLNSDEGVNVDDYYVKT